MASKILTRKLLRSASTTRASHTLRGAPVSFSRTLKDGKLVPAAAQTRFASTSPNPNIDNTTGIPRLYVMEDNWASSRLLTCQETGRELEFFAHNFYAPHIVRDHHPNVIKFEEELHMVGPEAGDAFCPLVLGQTLKEGRYTIVRKLGFGSGSSIWLATDAGEPADTDTDTPTALDANPNPDTPRAKYVAIKVLNINTSVGVCNQTSAEHYAHAAVAQADPHHVGYAHCVPTTDEFGEDSVHGEHVCLVTEPFGANVLALQSTLPGMVFPLAVVKRLTRDTLRALSYLHDACGIVHTDLKPANLLVRLPPPALRDAAISSHLLAVPSESYPPRHEPFVSPDPIITVKSQPLPNFGLLPDLSNLEVVLSDYGNVVPVDEHLWGEAVQPVMLRAPEVILGHPWSTPIDIWTVGCLIFEYLTKENVFSIRATNPQGYCEHAHLERIVAHVGPFEEAFLAKCERREEFVDENGTFVRARTLSTGPTIEERLLNCGSGRHANVSESMRRRIVRKTGTGTRMSAEEAARAGAFMRRCLTIDPSKRPSAQELLEDEWLKGV